MMLFSGDMKSGRRFIELDQGLTMRGNRVCDLRFLPVSIGFVILFVTGWGAVHPAAAQRPRISNVHPDFVIETGVDRPTVVMTGEHFDRETFRVVSWRKQNDAIRKALKNAGNGLPSLPENPPERTRSVNVIDVDKRVAVVRPREKRTALWVKTKQGVSDVYPMNMPKPFWISQETAEPGDRLHMYGYGIRMDHGGPRQYGPDPGTQIGFRVNGETYFAKAERELRGSEWTSDSRLVFFHVPDDVPEGDCTVFIHNGLHGKYGWVRAGQIEIKREKPVEPEVFPVTDFGAEPGDLEIDGDAIREAFQAASQAANGVVYVPAGLFRTRSTLNVPPGVTVRGAGQDTSVIEGTGYDPHGGKLAAVVDLSSHTTLKNLTVQGAVKNGRESRAMVTLYPENDREFVREVHILGCHINAREEDLRGRRDLHWSAIKFDKGRHITFMQNEIYGSIFFRRGERFEVVRNTIKRGVASINVSIHGWAFDSLLDSNQFVRTPGRVCFYPRRHSYIRYNEVHHSGRPAWANASEVYLQHGGYGNDRKSTGYATGAGERTLSDENWDWTPGEMEGTLLMIVEGKGFGQVRHVVDNTETTLTVRDPWRVRPEKGSGYAVGPFFDESAYYANVNNTPMFLSFWFDTVEGVIARHRDNYAGGLRIFGQDRSVKEDQENDEQGGHFQPAWYNLFVNNWMDGSVATLSTGNKEGNHTDGPPVFGNVFTGNRIRQPHMARTGKDRRIWAKGGLRIEGARTLVDGNQLTFSNIGVFLKDNARNTMVLRNVFQQIDRPVIDAGEDSTVQNNRTYRFGRDGEQKQELNPDDDR